MRIQSIQFEDRHNQWELSELSFFNDLTLLVGLSGVGKTRILKAISTLKDIAKGDKSIRQWGTTWKLRFCNEEGEQYQWEGALEDRLRTDFDLEVEDLQDVVFARDERAPRPAFTYERLLINNKIVVDRNPDRFVFDDCEMPKLPRHESALHLLREEDQIAPAANCFNLILIVEQSEDNEVYRSFPASFIEELKRKLTTLVAVRESAHSTRTKLAIIEEVDPDTFRQIVDRFKDVFPQVSDVVIKRVRTSIADWYQLQIKEVGVERWIPEHTFSSGMSRTLMHLSRMLLWPDGMVVLVDEFENSLGVNCINFVTQDMVEQSERLQFIITSHHPYIINNVDVANWKIVHRDGMTVTATNATELGLESSSHESFIKLLNLPEYQEGIAVP